MKRIKIMIVGFLLLSVILFWLVDIFTILPQRKSGNGNLGIIFMVPAAMVFLSLNWYLGVYFYRMTQWKVAFLIISLIGIIVAVVGEYFFVKNLIELLGGGPEITESRIYRFGWFNQYTNTLYFNTWTFLLGVSMTSFLSVLLKLVKKDNGCRENVNKGV